MTEGRRDASILIVAILIWAVLMTIHPTHARGPQIIGHHSLATLVHLVGVFVKPVLIYGLWRLSIGQGLDRPLVAIALCFYVLGQLAMLSAGTVSGWITPSVFEPLMHHGHATAGNEQTTVQIARFSSLINRGYANVYVILVSTACLLWSFGWTGRSVADQAVRVLGLLIGTGFLVWQLSGTFAPDPASMVIIAAGHTLWVVAAATAFGWPNSNPMENGNDQPLPA